jgi:hypothetical protein
MSEHHTNLTALLARTLPAFPPEGRFHGVQIVGKAAPKKHVILSLPENMRQEADKWQVRRGDAVEWTVAGEGVIVHPIGTPLPFELCDVVFVLMSIWANLMVPNPAEAQGHHVLPGELCRVDMLEFIRASEGSIGQKPRLVGVA